MAPVRSYSAVVDEDKNDEKEAVTERVIDESEHYCEIAISENKDYRVFQ